MKKFSKIFVIIKNLFLMIRYPQFHIGVFADFSHDFFKTLDKRKMNIFLGNATLKGNIKIDEGTKFFGKLECIGHIDIGRYTSINGPNTGIYSEINSIKIGAFCSIAPGVRIQEYYHDSNRATTYFINKHIFNENFQNDFSSKGGIIIEDDVWIGANSIILSGVTVKKGSIIGAGSVVTKDIPPYSIVGGNPAKIIKERFSKETIQMLEKADWTNWDIEKIRSSKDFFKKKLA